MRSSLSIQQHVQTQDQDGTGIQQSYMIPLSQKTLLFISILSILGRGHDDDMAFAEKKYPVRLVRGAKNRQ